MFSRRLVQLALCSAGVSLVASVAQAAPSAPGNVMVPPAATSSAGTTLIWSKPSSYSTVASYNVYKNGSLLANTTKLFYMPTGLSANTSYSFYVRSKDTSGVESSNSNTINVSTPASSTVINVTASPYSAKGDGSTLNTSAIQAAINACPSGGTVLIPSGTFKSGAIMLKSNMTLQVDGTLKGSDAIADYPYTSMRLTYYPNVNYMGLVNAYTTSYGSLSNIRIVGAGTIDGGTYSSGATLTTLGTAQTSAKGDTARGDLITVKGVNGLFLGGGLNVVHPSEHSIFVSYSNNITVNGLNVSTYGIHNADGIDLATSDTGYVFNSTFDTGDDCINFNAGTSAPGVTENRPINNFRVFNVTTKRGHGGVVFGSFTAGWIKNVLVEDSTFDGTDIGLRFKTGADRGGGSTQVTARDLTIKNITTDAISFDSSYPAGTGYPAASSPGVFNNVTLTNITVSTAKGFGIWIHGLSNAKDSALNMTNISLSSTKGASIDQFTNSTFNKVTFTSNTQSTVWTVTNTSVFSCVSCSPSYP
jgi:exo-poly-alpha-galacturonosidase